MAKEEHHDASLDLLGIKPVANAVEKVTDATVDGAMGFLRLICRPASEEFGLLLQDNVKAWRAVNAARLVKKAEVKFKAMRYPSSFKASPRLVSRILEEGSWVENENLQDMWAGLLASSCTEDANDDGNLIFTNLLSQMTSLQAKILDYVVIHSIVRFDSDDLYMPTINIGSSLDVSKSFDQADLHRVEREVAHLHSLGLIHYGMAGSPGNSDFVLELTALSLGLHLFVRCQGSTLPPQTYFRLHPHGHR